MRSQRIGRYEVEAELGRGGMATVYRAYDSKFKRSVAVKLMSVELTADPTFRARFEREAQTIASLEHPAIVPVHDYGEESGRPFLVMRLMTGGTLADRLRGMAFSTKEAAHIVKRVATALDAAHARGIVHRDLKPGNILFDQWGEPYLSDFGIVKLTESSSEDLTPTGTYIGTPAYMSPEQIEGNIAVDGRSDVYALGVILFEMMTGQKPYEADTGIALAYKHVHEPIPDILERNASLPSELQLVIRRAMAKARDQRYGTATLLALDFERVLTPEGPEPTVVLPPDFDAQTEVADAPVLVAPTLEGQASIAARLVKRRRLFLIGGIIIALLVVGCGALIIYLGPTVGSGEGQPDAEVISQAVGSEVFSISATGTASATPTSTTIPSATPSLTPSPTREPTKAPTVTPDPNQPPLNGAAGDTWKRPLDDMIMVYVPSGTFTMGVQPDTSDADPDESPQHAVKLSSFWLDQTEVTNAQYAAFINENGNQQEQGVTWIDLDSPELLIMETGGELVPEEGFSDHPVFAISWYGANAYCEGVGGRLPTEAEWEYTARGPGATTYPWGNNPPDQERLNYDGNVGGTTPVGFYPLGVSWIGALDMAGNVWEWVHDWYDRDYYENSPAEDPPGPTFLREFKVIRGGSWDVPSKFVRSTMRPDATPVQRDYNKGFRCAIPISANLDN